MGANRVTLKTTGNDKTRISIAFSATASGNKLKPVILIPRKKPLKDFIPPDNVLVVYGRSENFNHCIIREYFVNRVLRPYKISQGIDD